MKGCATHGSAHLTACLVAIALACCTTPHGSTPPPPRDAPAGSDAPGIADAAPSGELALQFIDPDHGGFPGDTELLVRGEGFDESTIVLVGGREVQPLDFELIDSRRINIRTPPGEPGPADVQVQRGDGVATLPGAFVYEPIVVDPPTGSVAGGTFLTITGLGTDFGASSSVTVDGIEMTGVTVLNDQLLTGFTPPGIAGAADIRVLTDTGVYEARRSYTYEATGDSFAGGMSGGPINGTVNVVVVDNNTKNGVDGAYVVIGDPATSPFQGFADDLGQITFSDPSLVGPITVTAGAVAYESTSFVNYDAENITIFLRTPPPPPDGPPPPAPQVGHIFGHVMFGDATGIGSPHWSLVPEPRTPTEVKRLYVTTTARTPFSSPYPPTRFIDYQYNPNQIAWEFDAWVRPSATAVVAIAGLYDPALDPSGSGVTGFQPFAMGVTRGILVGPGETLHGIDVVVNIPLDTAVRVDLDDPPALDSPGWDGPGYHKIRPFIDFGGEGVIHMNKHGMLPPPAPEDRPNHYRFTPGARSIVMSGMAPLTGVLADASYGFITAAYSEVGGAVDTNPYSVRVTRGITDVSVPVTLGQFLGVPRPEDPMPDATALARRLKFFAEGPPITEPTFHLHLLTSGTGEQLHRIFTRGDVQQVPIPDLTYGGLPAFPALQDISWTLWRIRVAGATFDQFNYRQLSSLYWDSYAADAWWVQFPSP